MDYVTLTVGASAVLAAWDIGRRYVGRSAAGVAIARVQTMESANAEWRSSVDAEVETLREQVAELGNKTGLALERTAKVNQFLEAQKVRPPSFKGR